MPRITGSATAATMLPTTNKITSHPNIVTGKELAVGRGPNLFVVFVPGQNNKASIAIKLINGIKSVTLIQPVIFMSLKRRLAKTKVQTNITK